MELVGCHATNKKTIARLKEIQRRKRDEQARPESEEVHKGDTERKGDKFSEALRLHISYGEGKGDYGKRGTGGVGRDIVRGIQGYI